VPAWLPSPTVAGREARVDRGSFIRWDRARVGGSAVLYGAAGSGPPIVFLHGWGLGPRAYRRTILALARIGCTVYAPALPGLGGTAELPTTERSLPGYGRFVGRFLDSLGVPTTALTVGHSLGGAVAIAFAAEHPDRTSSLLLANPVGSPVWQVREPDPRPMEERPIWHWGAALSGDLVQAVGSRHLAVVPAVLGDLLPNLGRSPGALWRTSQLGRGANLVAELRTIARRRVPVHLLWSDRDHVVPNGTFRDLCQAAGVVGEVVPGPHSWLIGDPSRCATAATHCLVEAGVTPRALDLRVIDPGT
jgi:pimeloyl-ACP methyl ester carboxylesterase